MTMCVVDCFFNSSSLGFHHSFQLSALFSPERIILPVRWLLVRVALDWLQWACAFWREHGCWCFFFCCSTFTWLSCYLLLTALKLKNVCYKEHMTGDSVCYWLLLQFFKFQGNPFFHFSIAESSSRTILTWLPCFLSSTALKLGNVCF